MLENAFIDREEVQLPPIADRASRHRIGMMDNMDCVLSVLSTKKIIEETCDGYIRKLNE